MFRLVNSRQPVVVYSSTVSYAWRASPSSFSWPFTGKEPLTGVNPLGEAQGLWLNWVFPKQTACRIQMLMVIEDGALDTS